MNRIESLPPLEMEPAVVSDTTEQEAKPLLKVAERPEQDGFEAVFVIELVGIELT